MILCYLPNGASDFEAQAREAVVYHWPRADIGFRNLTRVDFSDLEVEGVEGVVCPKDAPELIAAYHDHQVDVVDLILHTPPAMPLHNPAGKVPELSYTAKLFRDLLDTLINFPPPKRIALINCLRSLSYLHAMLHAELHRPDKSNGVISALTRRILHLRGKIS